MEFIIGVESRLDGRTLGVTEVAKVERSAPVSGAEELGLSLADGKAILRRVQDSMLRTQVAVISAAASSCLHCERQKAIKDLRYRHLRTAFGVVDVCCRRYRRCTCRGGTSRIEWPLSYLNLKRSTPELSFILAKWGSAIPYRRAAELLSEFRPLGGDAVSHATVRRHTVAVGQRLDQRTTEPAEYDWPASRRAPTAPAGRLTVEIDGTYIRATAGASTRQHY
jgi:hypothetical protein